MQHRRKRTFAVVATSSSVFTLVAYLVEIVRGKIPSDHRIGTNEIILIGITLLVCTLLLQPRLLARLSRVEMPGLKVDLEAVKERQDEQEQELRSMRLLLPLLLPAKERAHLRNLANNDCRTYVGAEIVRAELRHLRSMDLIRRVGEHSIGELTNNRVLDICTLVELTPEGYAWLERSEILDNNSQ